MNQDFECPRCGHCCQALETEQEPVAWASGLDREDILKANIEKLRKRYGEKYTNAAAIARADK